MKTYSVIFIVLILIMGLSCQQQSAALNDAQKAEIEKEVIAQQHAFIKACDALEAKAVAGLMSAKHFLAYISLGGGAYLARQAVVDSIKSSFSRSQSGYSEITLLKVYPMTSSLAIADVIVRGSDAAKDGTISKWQVAWTMTWQKEPTGWYIVHYHESWKEIK